MSTGCLPKMVVVYSRRAKDKVFAELRAKEVMNGGNFVANFTLNKKAPEQTSERCLLNLIFGTGQGQPAYSEKQKPNKSLAWLKS